jgi:hypothetical protein
MKAPQKSIFADKNVATTWANANVKHYISRGYEFTKIRDRLTILPKDALPYSQISVQAVCPKCKKQYTANPSLAYDPRNGLILCQKHHREFHSISRTRTRQRACTPMDFYQYLQEQYNWNIKDICVLIKHKGLLV